MQRSPTRKGAAHDVRFCPGTRQTPEARCGPPDYPPETAASGQRLTTRRKARSGRGALTAADLRHMAISEFAAWLPDQTNKLDRPFQEHTITNYTAAAKRSRSTAG